MVAECMECVPVALQCSFASARYCTQQDALQWVAPAKQDSTLLLLRNMRVEPHATDPYICAVVCHFAMPSNLTSNNFKSVTMPSYYTSNDCKVLTMAHSLLLHHHHHHCQVLEELDIHDMPIITAWNKVDACPYPERVTALAASRPDTVAISGATGTGLDRLMDVIAAKLEQSMMKMEVGFRVSEGVQRLSNYIANCDTAILHNIWLLYY